MKNLFLSTLVLIFIAATAEATTHVCASASYADVSAKVAIAVDGDTVMVPAGDVTWTSTLVISNNIQLIGAGEGVTIIGENLARGPSYPALIRANLTHDAPAGTTYTFRLSGFTFKQSSAQTCVPPVANCALSSDHAFIQMNGTGATVGTTYVSGVVSKVRLDHLTFLPMNGLYIFVDSMIGVGDHITGQKTNGTAGFPLKVEHTTWAPFTNPNPGHTGEPITVRPGQGYGSWADYPYHGTDKFWVWEDCNFDVRNNMTDNEGGCRVVIRHCTVTGGAMATHGPEGGSVTGIRAAEVYNNLFDGLVASAFPQFRSGTALYYNNVFQNFNAGAPLSTYRLGRTEANWGMASGHNRYDDNGGVANAGTLLYSGTVTSTTGLGTLVDSTKNFTSPQTINPGDGSIYQVINTSLQSKVQSDNPTVTLDPGWRWRGSNITGVAATTLTLSYDGSIEGGGLPYSATWTTGNNYEIRKFNTAFQQPGHGRHKLLIVNANAVGATPGIATDYNTYFFPYVSGDPKAQNPGLVDATFPLEPVYSWNNNGSLTTASYKNLVPLYGNLVSGRDYFSLAERTPLVAQDVGFPAQSYTRATSNYPLIGEDSDIPYAPLAYPHPLTGAAPGKIIQISGDLNFGNVIENTDSPPRTFAVSNLGSGVNLTVTSVSYPAHVTGPTTGFTVAPGDHRDIAAVYHPVAVGTESGNITVNSDADSGLETIGFTGTGVAGPTQDFLQDILRAILGRRGR